MIIIISAKSPLTLALLLFAPCYHYYTSLHIFPDFSVSIKWDLSNRSLATMGPPGVGGDPGEGVGESMSSNGNSWASCFRHLRSGPIDGPFSKKIVIHEDEEVGGIVVFRSKKDRFAEYRDESAVWKVCLGRQWRIQRSEKVQCKLDVMEEFGY